MTAVINKLNKINSRLKNFSLNIIKCLRGTCMSWKESRKKTKLIKGQKSGYIANCCAYMNIKQFHKIRKKTKIFEQRIPE